MLESFFSPLFVTFAGHRTICNYTETEARLGQVLEELASENSHIEFYVGLNGEFDIMAASAVRRLKSAFQTV